MTRTLPAPLLLVVGVAPLLAADKPDLEKLVTVKPGTIPVILTAPHGGRLAIPGVAERKGDGVKQFVAVTDTNTDLLAEKAAAAIAKELGGEPYLVIARFERKYCDANRPAVGAYEDDAAKAVYDAYHRAVKAACDEVKKTWGAGLLLDVHGQAASAGTIYRGTADLKTVSLLVDRHGRKAVTGPSSVLGVLAKRGHTIEPANDAVDEKEVKYNGGHTVRMYGVTTGVDAIQLEFGGDSRAKAKLDDTASDLAAAVKVFAKEYLPTEKVK